MISPSACQPWQPDPGSPRYPGTLLLHHVVGHDLAGELRAFGTAVAQRFGEEGVRTMLRAGGQPGAVTVASVAPEQRRELDRVTELSAALKTGERAGVSLAQRKAESERQGQRRGMRM